MSWMNATAGRRSVVSAVTTAAIARWMTYAFPAMVTTYKGSRLAAAAPSSWLNW